MDKIEKIRQEIERHRQAIRVLNEHTAPEQMSKTCAIFQYSDSILSELLSFFDTLSEEPDKSLEETAEEKYPVYWKSYPKDGIVRSESSYDTNKQCRESFIAGAEWQASQMPMPEDTVLFQNGVAEGRRLMMEDMTIDAEECELYWDGDFLTIDLNMAALGYSERDKVKVIVLKAEEE